ncbi:Mut7-C ubiquitin/RNAse domain-containing protein [Actinotalea sp. Marseille-Q4924]|uniref:Mut7-C ubiquitin/RNAse domain-containing protein n=1 Tax=Actinotalea sp. Marseille-Q4924 TaxID=2866571 RepID=UPI00210462A2|nr:Mut7-C ubiquitin/RNAse domain-containing protein [Actinotalea sp. Marseille-Q4924]
MAVPPDLRFLLPTRRRNGTPDIPASATDTVGHVVESVGIPLTEVGTLLLDGRVVPPSARALGRSIAVTARPRPQRGPTDPPRFLLDVHLGTLARRLRLLGLDVAWYPDGPDSADDALAARAAEERRVLLTQDRGLLRRRSLPDGALVRGTRVDDQAADVLDRFAPPLAPWTRCVACGGTLAEASADDVAAQLEPGTRRTYADFSRCTACGRVYWRGAHAARLEHVVAHAERVVAARRRSVSR